MKHITGLPIVFGSDSVDLGFIEQIDAAAVDRTLRDKNADVVVLRNHNSDLPLARRSARSLILTKQAKGLEIDAMVDESISFASDTIRLIQRGDARGGSFRFRTVEDSWELRNGVPFRRVLDMAFDEVSVAVAFPAYRGTTLAIAERGQRVSGDADALLRAKRQIDTRLRLAR